jgi:hypothetical protein
MHVTYPKLYNLHTNGNRKEGVEEAPKPEKEHGGVGAPPSKGGRPEKSPGKSTQAKKRKPTAGDVPAAKPVKQAKKHKTTSSSSGAPPAVVSKPGTQSKQPKKASTGRGKVLRVGSDGIALRVGPCRLGDTEEPLAQGTIITIDPTITGTDISGKKTKPPWADGVLCRFTTPILNSGDMELAGVVFQVCAVLILFTITIQIVN